PTPRCFLALSYPYPYPPSFPTRRSSDLDHHAFRRNDFKEHDERVLEPDATLPRTRFAERSRVRGEFSVHPPGCGLDLVPFGGRRDRKSTRLNSSHGSISYAVFCLKKKK